MVFLDASAVIYLLEGDTPTRQAAQQILAQLRGKGEPPPLAVSALSILECRVRPMRDNDHELLGRYDAFFNDPGLVIVPLDRKVLEHATNLQARYRLRTPDALQAASSLATGQQSAFVTGDGDFNLVPQLRVYRVEPGIPSGT